MSEALFERAAGSVHEARSAGTTPADHERYVDWDVPDPSGLPIAKVREIRDDISKRVGVLLESLERNSS